MIMRLTNEFLSDVFEILGYHPYSEYKHLSRRLKRIEYHSILEGLKKLEKGFINGMSSLGTDYMSRHNLLTSYVLYYFPKNLLKIHPILNELYKVDKNAFDCDRVVEILDLGAGPGTLFFGWLTYMKDNNIPLPKRFNVTAVDRGRDCLDFYKQLFRRVCNKTQYNIFTLQRNLLDVQNLGFLRGRKRFDIILIGNLLNELYHEAENPSAMIIDFLHKKLREGGYIIWIEPADRRSSRRLLTMRDLILKTDNTFSVIAPCTRQEYCPALYKSNHAIPEAISPDIKSARDNWCHHEILWTPPDYLPQLAQELGLHYGTLKFSYLVLKKSNAVFSSDVLYRVVSSRIKEKGKMSIFICGREGRIKIEMMNRDRSGSNEVFFDLRRGDLISIDKKIDGLAPIIRLDKETNLKKF